MMEQYQQDLTGHILTQEIETYLSAIQYEYPNATSDSETSGDEIVPSQLQQKKQFFKKLSFKIDAKVGDHTLSYVKDLWQSLTNQFELPRPAMILHRIAEGCICITWLIPTNLVTHITRMVRESSDMFAEKQIQRVMLEEQCLYPMETLIEHPLLDSEKEILRMKEAESQECVGDITSGEYECKVRGEEQAPAVVKFPSERPSTTVHYHQTHSFDPDTRGVPPLSPLSPPSSAKEKLSGREEVTKEQRSIKEGRQSEVPQFKRHARVITSDDEFEHELKQAQEALVVVDFITEQCRWTGYLDLVFDILRKHYTEAKFLSVDAGKCQTTAMKYDVRTLPTYAFFRKGELLRMFHGTYHEAVATVKYFLGCKEEGRHSLVKSITSDEEFEHELRQTGEILVVVDFSIEWCGWSVIMDPINALFSEHFTAAHFLKVDSEKCRNASSKYGVQSYPTFAFIRKRELLHKFSGANPEKLVVTTKHFLESESKGAYSPGKGYSRVRVISSDKEFERELRQPEETLVVANFTAAGNRWSMFMNPVFAVLSEHHPTARFLQVDTEKCRGVVIMCDVRMDEIPMFAFFRNANLLYKFSGFQCEKLATTVKHYLEGKGAKEKSSKEQPFYVIVDPSEPTTKVKIKLADGSNLIETFNHSHTVGDLRHFISRSRPELAASSYTLMTSYPEKELKDDAQTLAAAELFNATITQKTKLSWK